MSDDPTVSALPPEEGPPIDAGATTFQGTDGALTDLPTGAFEQYRLGDEIARGGMGVVYRAADAAFAREVAIKVLSERYDARSAAAARFFDEARITGQLQHPAIPPVHALGTLPDGRPFLAMKLIEGRTLAEHLDERRDPSENLGRWLAAFEQVCQGVGYAHARRIIHRDLKPANVMVGAFGEVQVMDWGLAKKLGEDSRPEPIHEGESTANPDATTRTQAGSLMGTLAFMPPEQASGDIEKVDERSDVFGLGAILCVILTGAPPYADSTFDALRKAAASGELREAYSRLDSGVADSAWIALAKRCLAANAAERYRTAGELAEAVASLRADAEKRAREAEMDRARAEVKAGEERKRRRVQRALAATVVLIVAGAGVAAWWVDRMQSARESAEKDRAAELLARQLTTERDVAAALKEVQLLREQGLTQTDDPDRWSLTLLAARSAWKRAETALASGEATDELRARVAFVAGELERDERDQVLLLELDRAADSNEIRFFMPTTLSTVVSKRFAEAFRRHGFDLKRAPTADAVAWLKSHRFRDRIALAIRSWTFAVSVIEQFPMNVYGDGSHRALAGTVGEAGFSAYRLPIGLDVRLRAILAETDNPFAKEWWSAVNPPSAPYSPDAEKLKVLIQRPELRRVSSRELASFADGLSGRTLPDVYRQLLDLGYERFPGEFWVHLQLAMLGGRGNPNAKTESFRHLTAAIAAKPRSAIARSMMGMELMDRKRLVEGRRMLQSASEVDPSSPWPHLLLGMEASYKQNWEAAIEPFKAAAQADPDVAYLMIPSTLGIAPDELRGWLIREVAAVQPNHPGSHDILGTYFYNRGEYRAALAELRLADAASGDDYSGKLLIRHRLLELQNQARWESQLGAVLAGTVRPQSYIEWTELAQYAARFERRYALATRFAAKALELNPATFTTTTEVLAFSGWAVQASFGAGNDAAGLLPEERLALRRRALQWLTGCRERIDKTSASIAYFTIRRMSDFAPVRDAVEMAKLPPGERAEWEQLWIRFSGKLPQAPAPRVKMTN